MTVTEWKIPGAANAPVLGDTHRPSTATRGVIVIAHGFKGYKDYGMFPRLASCAADAGFVAHRFNFSHSGMTNRIDTFERPDLFERDTWNRQVEDLRCVMRAVSGGALEGGGMPLVLFGHSRGGVAVLLTAGRFADDDELPAPAGVMTAAAPSTCRGLSEDDARTLREQGWVVSPSSRTGQDLRVGRAFLQEQLDDPAAHDLPVLAARIRCPVLIAHGEDDPTVPVACAAELAAAIGAAAQTLVIAGGDHVFNTPNPMLPEAAPSPQLAALRDGMLSFAGRVCGTDG